MLIYRDFSPTGFEKLAGLGVFAPLRLCVKHPGFCFSASDTAIVTRMKSPLLLRLIVAYNFCQP
jgi:hypothetical protein